MLHFLLWKRKEIQSESFSGFCFNFPYLSNNWLYPIWPRPTVYLTSVSSSFRLSYIKGNSWLSPFLVNTSPLELLKLCILNLVTQQIDTHGVFGFCFLEWWNDAMYVRSVESIQIPTLTIICVVCSVTQSCPTLSNHGTLICVQLCMECRLSGSSVCLCLVKNTRVGCHEDAQKYLSSEYSK